MRRLVVVLLLVVACKNRNEAPKVQVVDDPEIGKAVEQVLGSPPEAVSAKDKAAATDPTPILGEWNIKHMQSKINGKLGELSELIMPGSWVFTADGSFKKLGGNELSGTY